MTANKYQWLQYLILLGDRQAVSILIFFLCINFSRTETIEYEAQLRHKNEMLRVEAELKGK